VLRPQDHIALDAKESTSGKLTRSELLLAVSLAATLVLTGLAAAQPRSKISNDAVKIGFTLTVGLFHRLGRESLSLLRPSSFADQEDPAHGGRS